MLSINEIVRTKSFKDARLLTDVDLTAPVIGSVTVGEVPDIAQWLTGGEMVLSTLFSAREAGDEKFDTVRNIINGPAGALVVKLGRFVERLPDDIISLAKEKRFPIISLPPEVRWTNVIMDISRLLGQRELAKLTWLEEIRQQFGKIATGNGDVSAITKMLAGLIGCRVGIEDLVGGVVAVSDGVNEASIKSSTKSRLVFGLDDGYDRCGYLVVYTDEADDADGLDESQLLAVEKAVEAANIEMSKVRASVDAEMRLMGNLFSLLNSGNLTGEQAVSRAAFLQIDLTRGFIVCTIDLVHAVDGAVLSSIDRLMQRAFTVVKRTVPVYFPGSLVALDAKRINTLLVPPTDVEPTRRPGLVSSMLERVAQGLDDVVPQASFRIGASSFHADAAHVNTAYNEAITAALIAAATGRAHRFGNFKDLGLYKLLLRINGSHPDETDGFCRDTLGVIEEYDRKREGDLMHTLEVFFDRRENINDAAAQLFTHRHTVRYRLQRIAELSGFDPFNPDDREILRIALKLKQLLALGG